MPPEFKTGDTAPVITGTVTDANGPVNIFSYTSLRFIAVSPSRVLPITGAAVKIDDGTVPLRGKWSYQFGPTDLDTAGDSEVEIEGTRADSKIQTFPNAKSRNPHFTVSADLD
jgi:hypothetical protein